jgi:hypothetical protein
MIAKMVGKVLRLALLSVVLIALSAGDIMAKTQGKTKFSAIKNAKSTTALQSDNQRVTSLIRGGGIGATGVRRIKPTLRAFAPSSWLLR